MPSAGEQIAGNGVLKNACGVLKISGVLKNAACSLYQSNQITANEHRGQL